VRHDHAGLACSSCCDKPGDTAQHPRPVEHDDVIPGCMSMEPLGEWEAYSPSAGSSLESASSSEKSQAVSVSAESGSKLMCERRVDIVDR
jgi:hypothetical protein